MYPGLTSYIEDQGYKILRHKEKGDHMLIVLTCDEKMERPDACFIYNISTRDGTKCDDTKPSWDWWDELIKDDK